MLVVCLFFVVRRSNGLGFMMVEVDKLEIRRWEYFY